MPTENYNYFYPEWFWIEIDFECECNGFRFRDCKGNENLECPECGRKYKITMDILQITEEK
jgi:hypothetical protein